MSPTSVTRMRALVVKVTAGSEALERCHQAFNVAATAVSAGAQVSVWLTGEATWLALPGRAEQLQLPHAPPLHELRDLLLDQASLTVCTQCAARRDIGSDDLLPGARIAGATAYVEEILGADAQALVY